MLFKLYVYTVFLVRIKVAFLQFCKVLLHWTLKEKLNLRKTAKNECTEADWSELG